MTSDIYLSPINHHSNTDIISLKIWGTARCALLVFADRNRATMAAAAATAVRHDERLGSWLQDPEILARSVSPDLRKPQPPKSMQNAGDLRRPTTFHQLF